jgi:hypothetical protein
MPKRRRGTGGKWIFSSKWPIGETYASADCTVDLITDAIITLRVSVSTGNNIDIELKANVRRFLNEE